MNANEFWNSVLAVAEDIMGYMHVITTQCHCKYAWHNNVYTADVTIDIYQVSNLVYAAVLACFMHPFLPLRKPSQMQCRLLPSQTTTHYCIVGGCMSGRGLVCHMLYGTMTLLATGTSCMPNLHVCTVHCLCCHTPQLLPVQHATTSHHSASPHRVQRNNIKQLGHLKHPLSV